MKQQSCCYSIVHVFPQLLITSVMARCIYRFSLLPLADWNICAIGDGHQQNDERTKCLDPMISDARISNKET